jgi:hypothetical protein
VDLESGLEKTGLILVLKKRKENIKNAVVSLPRVVKKYPKCVPAAKARTMSESQKRSAVKRKRARAQGVGGKPTNVRTFAKRSRKARRG